MALIKTEAFVLKNESYSESDYLTTFFTKKLGRIKVFSKGVKKITSRRLAYLDTGNFVEIILRRKNDLFYLEKIQLKSGLIAIKNNKQKIPFLFLFLFSLDRLLPEAQQEKKIYLLAKKYISHLVFAKDDHNSLKKISTSFYNQLLQSLGFSDRELNLIEIKKTIEEIINEKIPLFIYN